MTGKRDAPPPKGKCWCVDPGKVVRGLDEGPGTRPRDGDLKDL